MSLGSTAIHQLSGARVFSTAKEHQHLLRANAGKLLKVAASNLGTVDLFLQLHDAAAAVANPAVPMFVVPLAAGGFASLGDFTFTTGIVVALSSTDATYTAPGVAAGWFYGESN